MQKRLPSLVAVLLSGLIVWLMFFSLGLYRSIPWWFYLTLLGGVWYVVEPAVFAVFRAFGYSPTERL